MRVLALDTSTSDLITGLVDTESGVVVDQVIVDTRAHNELLVPTVERLLADAAVTYADLDAIVVGCGPGPFTGLRVGMATASALGVALGIPVHGVCSHDAIAQGREGRWVVATDARRKEVYWAAYADGERVAGPDVVKPEVLGEALVAVGVAAESVDSVVLPEALAPRLAEELAGLPRTEGTPRAEQLVAVAQAAGPLDGEAAPLVPLYLRRPDAVPPKEKPRSAALTMPDAMSDALGEK